VVLRLILLSLHAAAHSAVEELRYVNAFEPVCGESDLMNILKQLPSHANGDE